MTTFYFGVNSRDGLENILSWGVKDVLVSFAYLKNVKGDPKEWKEMGVRKVFFDSGAFTFQDKGSSKEEDYIEYVLQHGEYMDDYALMDYIAPTRDEQRERPPKPERRAVGKVSVRTSLKALKGFNLRKRDTVAEAANLDALDRFHRRGLDPIPVWHPHTDSYQLAGDYARRCRKVGIGATKASLATVQTFQAVIRGVPAHGFGFTRLARFDLVRRFDSVDSVSWSDAAKYSGYSAHGRMKGTGEFGGALWQMTGFARNMNPETGSKVRLVDIKDFEGSERDKAQGLRTKRATLRQQIVVQAYLRRLHSLGIIDYAPPE